MNDESYPNSNIRDMSKRYFICAGCREAKQWESRIRALNDKLYCSYYCGLDSGVTKDRWSGEQ